METVNIKIIISTYKEDNQYFSVGISKQTNKIIRIALPQPERDASITEISKLYPDFELSDKYRDVAKSMSKIYKGEKVDFKHELLDLDINESDNNESPLKTLFEREVLLETARIPYGEVRTYKYIAGKLQTHAYRAVGSALAKNPYPLIIPCHRVVKSDMRVGQYGGGCEMKKRILKNEGVQIKGDKIVKK